MTDALAPAIALLASGRCRREVLAEVLAGFGYRLVFIDGPERLTPAQLGSIDTDLWLLDVSDECEAIDWLLDQSDVPVLLGVGDTPEADSEDYPRWKRQLYNKLLPLIGAAPGGEAPTMAPASTPNAPACVWVLAASLGGPAAVKAFLDHLPASLPVAFVYAQHIDATFEAQLPQIVGRHNEWRIINCVPGVGLAPGEVLIAPIERSMQFGGDRQVQMRDAPWPGPYQPAIESVIDEVMRGFAPACGAIIFSGMGEDGVAACGRLRQSGMEVWTQTAESAACGVMPQAVQDAGHSSRQGTPEQLASAMRDWLEQEWAVAH
ncbi:chemotaxis protein CheB [Halopseudomonas nanhaiensis]|uniref:chemotaxis protein CheB n=1 Tax=Halopseudomonas nanhaiensis TaxID=2830842 RepID=UPI001CBA6E57|nr:chemotaxis protein CheB [Halopseudomonas nanhaiensis]UAW98231.1 chemotaxis protein CheB [Halopseudomonas nanhaiensis]